MSEEHTASTSKSARAGNKRVKKSILQGRVEAAEIREETLAQSKTKLMKVITITRVPGGRVANIELRVSGTLYDLDIDEATARAIAAVFD